jgi:hypothetical protein
MSATAVLAAAKAVAGGVKMIDNTVKKNKFQPKMTSATDRAIDESRRMSTTTEAVGASTAREQIRQTQADTVGQMQQQTGDANKIAGASANANMQALNQNRQIDAAAQSQRLQGQQAYAQSLSKGAAEEQADQARFDQQMAGDEAVAQNMLGSAAGDVIGMSRDNKMLSAYSDIQKGKTIDSDWLKAHDKLPGQGSGWAKNMMGMNGGNKRGAAAPLTPEQSQKQLDDWNKFSDFGMNPTGN